jgi:hypothetical protein
MPKIKDKIIKTSKKNDTHTHTHQKKLLQF